MDTKQ